MFSLLSSNYSQLSKVIAGEKTLFSKKTLREAGRISREQGRTITHVLLENAQGAEADVLEAIAKSFNVPHVRLRKRTLQQAILRLIPKEVAEEHSIIAFKKEAGELYVATTAPEEKRTIEFVKTSTGLTPRVFLTTPEDIKYALMKYDHALADEFETIIEAGTKEALKRHDDPEKMAQFVPIIKMVNAIIERAIVQRASDIHIEPGTEKVMVRFRVDGMLQTIVTMPLQLLPSLCARIKILAHLKIDEHRIPQDGRMTLSFDGRDIAIRVAIMPTLHGAAMSLRLLDTASMQRTVNSLGFNSKDFEITGAQMKKPHGLILVAGPTGSGKTTTLYTLLKTLSANTSNICTIEDPIEYALDGVNQTQINPAAGLTFAQGLRALLRHDPNIIMVGEIRDAETATIAMHAAMTGHLVLSTIHTNSAYLTPQRLADMGIAPYLSSSVINTIVGQRLARTLCQYCVSHESLSHTRFDEYRASLNLNATFAKLKRYGYLPRTLTVAQCKLPVANGCKRCNYTGYRGRIGIYELLVCDEATRTHIARSASGDELQKHAAKQGMLTMQEDGVLKVCSGMTTIEEVVRVTSE